MSMCTMDTVSNNHLVMKPFFWRILTSPSPETGLSLTHDLLRVLSMDTWWNFGHEIKQEFWRILMCDTERGYMCTCGTNSESTDDTHTPLCLIYFLLWPRGPSTDPHGPRGHRCMFGICNC